MKRILSVLLALCLVLMASAALGEVDLTAMSRDELLVLEEQIIKELTSRPDYKEVTVPPGVYEVGVDIPAGKWTISGVDVFCTVDWGKALDEYKVKIPTSEWISGYVHGTGVEGVDWELTNGTFIVIGHGTVKFSPTIPKSLGF